MSSFIIDDRVSPLQPYEGSISNSVWNIAPEHGNEMQRIIDEYKIQLEFDYAVGYSIRAKVDIPSVALSIRALEFLWAACFSYLTWHEKYHEVQIREIAKGTKAPVLLLNEFPDCEIAMSLFIWAKNNLKNKVIEPWPSDLPKPDKNRDIGSINNYADELFHCAIAWTMHHEINHIALGHQAVSPNPIPEEHDADDAATRWILSNTNDAKKITKRSTGIVAAIVALRAIGRGGSTHPDPEERLDRFFNAANLPDYSPSTMFAMTALQCQSALLGNRIKSDAIDMQTILGDILYESLRGTN